MIPDEDLTEDERRIVSLGAALGEELPVAAPEHITALLLQRLREAEALERHRRRQLRIGAALSLALAASLLFAVILRDPAPSGSLAVPATSATALLSLPLAELDGAGNEALAQVLSEFDAPPADPSAAPPDAEELDPSQLDWALSTWEES